MAAPTTPAAEALAERKPAVDEEHPWLGLESFSEETKAYFFGRTAETKELAVRLQNAPLTVLFARSGLGKTSLLRAGLIPYLHSSGYYPQRLRILHDPGTNTPARQITEILDDPPVTFDVSLGLPTDALSTLWLRVHHHAAPSCVTHLFLDQFEEIFIFGPEHPGTEDELRQALAILVGGFMPAGITTYVNELTPPPDSASPDAEAVARAEEKSRQFYKGFSVDTPPLPVAISMRADYVYALNRWRSHLPFIGRNAFELRELRGPQAFEAIYEPGARRKGKRPIISEKHAKDLVRLLADRPDEPDLNAISAVPPILSLVCAQLNSRRFPQKDGSEKKIAETIPDIDIRRGPDEILSEFYFGAFNGMPREIRHEVERLLLSDRGHRIAIDYETLLDAFAKHCRDRSVDRAHDYFELLIARRLLSPVEMSGRTRYELIHDRLCPIATDVRDKRLARELTRAAEDARQAAEKARLEAEKRARQLDKARRAAVRYSRFAGYSTLLAIVALVVALYLLKQSNDAWKNSDNARRGENKALDDANTARAQAVAALKAADEERTQRLQQEVTDGKRDHTMAKELAAKGKWSSAIAQYASSLRHWPENPAAIVELWYLCRHGEAAKSIMPEQFIPLRAVERVPVWSRDGRFLVVRQDAQNLFLIDRQRNNAVEELKDFPSSVAATSFDRDSHRLLIAAEKGGWRSYTLDPFQQEYASKAPTRTLAGHPFSFDGRFLATEENDGDLRILNASSGELVKQYRFTASVFGDHGSVSLTVRRAVWSPGGDRIAIGTSDGHFAILNLVSAKWIKVETHDDGVYSPTTFDRTGQYLLVSKGRINRLLSLGEVKGLTDWAGFGLVNFAVPEKGVRLMTIGLNPVFELEQSNATLVSLEDNGEERGAPLLFPTAIGGSFSDSGLAVLLFGGSQQMQLFSAPEGAPRSALQEFDLGQNSGSLSPDGLVVARVGAQPGVELWRAPPAALSIAQTIPENYPLLPVSPDGRWKVTAATADSVDISYQGSAVPSFHATIAVQNCVQAGWAGAGHTLVIVHSPKTATFMEWDPPLEAEEDVQKTLLLLGGKTFTEDGAITSIPFDQRSEWRKRMQEVGPTARSWAPLLSWWIDGRVAPPVRLPEANAAPTGPN